MNKMIDQKTTYDTINKLMYGVIVICLTIIGFFLSQVYTKVVSTELSVKQIQIELAKLQVETSHYVTREEMITYVNNKLNKI